MALAAVARSAGGALDELLCCHFDKLAEELRAACGGDGSGSATRLNNYLKKSAGLPPSDRVRRAAIASLAIAMSARPPARPLPISIEALYPRTFQVLAEYLANSAVYDPDCYAKDARFVAGVTVPAGAQLVDLQFADGWGSDLRSLLRHVAMIGRLSLAGDARGAAMLCRPESWNNWLEIHTDQRNLEDFNEGGWDDCYRRIADILRGRSELAGLWGASWFYDPQLLEISPRLAYLQERPLERGAVMVRLRGGAIHAQRAAQTSPTRTSLIAAGRYRPICYAMFWPRRELLAWASGPPSS